MSFEGDFRKFSEKLKIRSDKLVRRVVLGIAADIVKATPVDTGLARANWFFSFTRDSSIDPTPSRNGASSISRAAAFASTLKAGPDFYIINNLPYIMALEYGHSTQAPAGMARITVARWQNIVNKALGEVK